MECKEGIFPNKFFIAFIVFLEMSDFLPNSDFSIRFFYV